MDQQMSVEEKKSFLKNDRLLVCSMLTFYAVCILGLIAVTFWGLDRRNKQSAANATSTANAIATQQVNATATAIAHAKKLEDYKFIDRFDTNVNDWMTGYQDNEYWVGEATIRDGVYLWDVMEVKKTFIYWAGYSQDKTFKDFDVYVDLKILEAETDQVCGGLIYRKSSKGWDHGGYAFKVCNSAFFKVSYHADDWQSISEWRYSPAIRPIDWNRIEVNARGDHFTFLVNNVVVFETTDDRLKEGKIALFVELNDQNPAKVSFDNFGLQPR
jgi:hypothetical protein